MIHTNPIMANFTFGGSPDVHLGASTDRFAQSGGDFSKEFQGGLGARADVEFVVNVLYVRTNGFQFDAGRISDFLVLEASGQESEDFFFALGEVADFGFGGGVVLEEADKFSGDGHGHRGAAGLDLFDGIHQFGSQ